MENDHPVTKLLFEVAAMTLATTGPDGEPHAAPVYFAAGRGLRLYFFSAPNSQHSLDLARDGRLAAAVHPECSGWQDIRGVQMRGVARRVEPGAEWEAAWELYAAKFPFVSELRQVVEANELYVFALSWARLVDNRQGFGYKQEWTFPQDGGA